MSLPEDGTGDFARELHAEVIERSKDSSGNADFKENAFAQLVVEYLTDAGVAEDGQVCYLEKNLPTPWGVVKTNGYYMPEEADQIDLFYCHYLDDEGCPALTAKDIDAALRRSMRLVELGRRGDFSTFEESTEPYDMLTQIRENADSLQRLRVFLLTDCYLPERARKSAEKQVKNLGKRGGLALRVEIVDMARLSRIVRAGAEHDPIEIDFRDDFIDYRGGPIPCIKAEAANPSYDVYLAVIPGVALAELYEEYGSRLLELNVRSFLQVTGKVNKGMRNTLHTEPSMFLPYNNGISATADSIDVEHGGNELTITRLRGLQIVNGGQTMASIHRAQKIDKVSIDDVMVQAKLTVLRKMAQSDIDDLVQKISLYANTQNKVNEADFSANDPFHVQIEKLANTIYVPGEQSRWFYERSRGSYQTAKARFATTPAKRREFERLLPAQQKFTKTDLAKYAGSWDQLPHIVSRGSQKNFVSFMARTKNERGKKWLPDADYYRQLVAQAILFRRVEKIVRDEAFPAYRANIVAYTVALLAFRFGQDFRLERIWQHQGISDELTDALIGLVRSVHAQIIDSADGRNVTEWCKKEDCWLGMQVLAAEIDGGLPELAPGRPSDVPASTDTDAPHKSERPSITVDDVLAASRVMDVPADVWRELARWGQATEALTQPQIRLAMQLHETASAGWEKAPTAAVTKRTVHLLDAAERQVGPLADFRFTDEDWKST